MDKHIPITIIERCHKETEDVIQTETVDFLKNKVTYLKDHSEEFIYVESPDFETIRVDALALEIDDVFQTYTALFGLALQKKLRDSIQSYLNANLQGEGIQFSMLFSGEDGVWDVNITLDGMEGFDENLTLEHTVQLVVRFVADLVNAAKDGN
ncbi:protoporphyrinogen oxidase [Sporosarcina sp. 179-K 3D1 HS]|uniref:protoporphyrinogen oxidase n=1 Tax=Sporosarcina sp. 179-K 3D1 HS TaxID=3232169 RepID=UPI0039A1DC6D